jgi:DUF1680 family protein
LTLNRLWEPGDKIELSLPMGLHIDPMPDDQTIQAVMYGPLVLAGRLDPVTREMSYGDYEPKPGDQVKVPDITANAAKPTAWIEPDAKQPLTFHAVGQAQPLAMVPLYKVIHERYVVYWKVDNKSA